MQRARICCLPERLKHVSLTETVVDFPVSYEREEGDEGKNDIDEDRDDAAGERDVCIVCYRHETLTLLYKGYRRSSQFAPWENASETSEELEKWCKKSFYILAILVRTSGAPTS